MAVCADCCMHLSKIVNMLALDVKQNYVQTIQILVFLQGFSQLYERNTGPQRGKMKRNEEKLEN